ncbi:MAG: glycosyltransferase family 39 protein [Planctomycetes bacterium]|nr:glycosyltransferase family 39 protein [Planctomycetota bacterium]
MDPRPTRTPSFAGREALSILLVALTLRLAFVAAFDTPGDTSRGLWEWGYEAASIAHSLVAGEGFANTWTRDVAPWSAGSGPTGWLLPAYPGLLALLLELTGGLTRTTAWLLFAIQGLVSSFTCVLLWGLGNRLGAPRAGRIAGWALALHPLAIWHAASTVWDTTLAAFAFTLLLWRLAGCERARGPRTWTSYGFVFGLALLVNPAPLVLAPVVAWVAWRARPGLGPWLGALVPCALAAGAVVLPWMLRNQGEVGVFALRTNLGVELAVGNYTGSDGRYARDRHPSHSPEEFLRYREVGEARYAADALERATSWIGANPGRFLVLTLRRTAAWWIGEDPWTDPRTDRGLRARDDPQAYAKWILHAGAGILGLLGALLWARAAAAPRPYLLALFLVPPVYCVTHVLERYRWPIDPLLVLCAAWLVARVFPRLLARPDAGPR